MSNDNTFANKEAVVFSAFPRSTDQRSLFRFPGGKTWLVPRIRQWLNSIPGQPHEFIEPFAGGGVASLTVAIECLAQQVTMVERDEQIAAVWQTVLNGEGELRCTPLYVPKAK